VFGSWRVRRDPGAILKGAAFRQRFLEEISLISLSSNPDQQVVSNGRRSCFCKCLFSSPNLLLAVPYQRIWLHRW